MTTLKTVTPDQIRNWYATKTLGEPLRSIGAKRASDEHVEDLTGLPLHVRRVTERLVEEHGDAPADVLDSIPFFSLCHGLLLPLAGLAPERVARLFGFQAPAPPAAAAREELLHTFFTKDGLGLTPQQKIACVLGDPFLGENAGLKRDSLLSLLESVSLVTRRQLLDKLPVAGEVAALFAENRPTLHRNPPLTAAEVLETLRIMPKEGRNSKLELLRSLLLRMGKLEAYFLARLVLRRAGVGFDYQGPLISRVLAAPYGADQATVAHAISLTSVFHVAKVLEEEGPAGLQKIRLQPLVAVRPALASQSSEARTKWPAWVERKYDGIRLMAHKSTDATGSVLCGAYTRNKNDWLELIRGLDASLRMLPCRSVILDGELVGTVADLDGARPATVYDVHTTIQGTRVPPVPLKFVAFDIVYLDGQDLTPLPLRERRRILTTILAPLALMPLPLPIILAEGQLAAGPEDANRLYQHFRNQGHEGVVAKDLEGPYRLGERDPSWTKRKPEVTLDLAVLGAVLSVTTKESGQQFGSYVIGARAADGSFVDVGDVAGVDREREAAIRAEIVSGGLLTGKRFDRPSSSGVRPGYELRPDLVVTVRFEGVVRDSNTKELSLRDPKIVAFRSDKRAAEADTMHDIEELYLKQRVS
jgi:DNA ligase-1